MRHRGEGYGCPIATANLGDLTDVLFLRSAPAHCWLIVVIPADSCVPTTLGFLVSFFTLLSCLLVPPVLACCMLCTANITAIASRHGTDMGSHGGPVACTLALLVCLIKDSASFVLCCPCARCLGSAVRLATKLRRWRWLPRLPGCYCPGLSCQTQPYVRSIMI